MSSQDGDDTLDGGRDTFEGGDGNDVIRAHDGIAETVDCGEGATDGFDRPQDCDDASRVINPGAPEVFGNAVDEDCSGRADPFPRLRAEIASRWSISDRGTKAVRLVVSGAPAGATVVLRCRGGSPVARFKIRDGRLPKRTSLCLRPGAGRPRGC